MQFILPILAFLGDIVESLLKFLGGRVQHLLGPCVVEQRIVHA
jgi:hypothetical protein